MYAKHPRERERERSICQGEMLHKRLETGNLMLYGIPKDLHPKWTPRCFIWLVIKTKKCFIIQRNGSYCQWVCCVNYFKSDPWTVSRTTTQKNHRSSSCRCCTYRNHITRNHSTLHLMDIRFLNWSYLKQQIVVAARCWWFHKPSLTIADE